MRKIAGLLAAAVLSLGIGLSLNAPPVGAQRADPPATPPPPSRNRNQTSGDLTDFPQKGSRPFTWTSPSSSESLGVGTSSIGFGEPGLSYRLVTMFGVTEEAYPADVTHLNAPEGIFIDPSDNLFVAEGAGSRILKYASDGSHQLTIGKAGFRQALNDSFYYPIDVAVDSSGNIWMADFSPNRVMKFDSSGSFLDQIGVTWEQGADNQHFMRPYGLAFDSAGKLYVSDFDNHRVQVFEFPSGDPVYHSTIGETGVSGSDDSHLSFPRQVDVDSGDRVYVLDSGNDRIQRCQYSDATSSWTCETYFDNTSNPTPDVDLQWVNGLTIDSSDDLFVADFGAHHVIKCTAVDECQVFAGETGVPGSDQNHFDVPGDVAVDSSGNVFVTDFQNFRLQVFDSSGSYLETRGVTGEPYTVDSTHLNGPRGLVAAPDGSLYVAENFGYRLVKLDPAGNQVWTVGEAGVFGDDNGHFGSFWAGPEGPLALDSQGRVYISDTGNHRVQIFNSDGSYFTTMGSGYGFSCPAGVAISPVDDTIYVLDRCNQRVQVLDQDRIFQYQIGETGVTGSDNAHFNWPSGLGVSPAGDLYVADTDNHRVQVFDPTGAYVRTLGVTGECGDDFVHFCFPHDVGFDGDGHLLVAGGWGTNRVQVFDSNDNYLTTIGGEWGSFPGAFRFVANVTVGSTGEIFVADYENHRVHVLEEGIPDWRQINLNGFSDPTALGMALGAFQEELYVGGRDQIWRHDASGWTALLSSGFGGTHSNGVDDLLEFGSQLYAGMWTTDTDNPDVPPGGEIWRSTDGTTWEQVVSGGFGDPDQAEVFQLTEFGDQIYAGTWSYATDVPAQVWRSTSGDAGTWSQVGAGAMSSDIGNRVILDFETYGDELFLSTINSSTGSEIWASPDGSSWAQRNTDGFGVSVRGATALESFKGWLYALGGMHDGGAQIWRCQVCDGSDWEQVVSGGLGNPKVRGTSGLESAGGFLYAVIATGSPFDDTTEGLHVWRSANGTNWTEVVDDGFGDANNWEPYWDNGVLNFEGALHIGTLNFAHGSEVWKRMYEYSLPIIIK